MTEEKPESSARLHRDCSLPLCPDHRDKVKRLTCRQCAVESLGKTIDDAIEALDPGMTLSEIVTLREKLIRRREYIGK